jgi:hypothetical protein
MYIYVYMCPLIYIQKHLHIKMNINSDVYTNVYEVSYLLYICLFLYSQYSLSTSFDGTERFRPSYIYSPSLVIVTLYTNPISCFELLGSCSKEIVLPSSLSTVICQKH